jgi:hypothetical protein
MRACVTMAFTTQLLRVSFSPIRLTPGNHGSTVDLFAADLRAPKRPEARSDVGGEGHTTKHLQR